MKLALDIWKFLFETVVKGLLEIGILTRFEEEVRILCQFEAKDVEEVKVVGVLFIKLIEKRQIKSDWDCSL